MILKSITAANFRSFGQLDFQMPEAGLWHLHGANGHGKSTLLEAVHWCLFGRTSRGVKAGNVANWRNQEDCWAELRGSAFGKNFVLRRSWGPISLTLNGEAVDQETLEKELGISEERFKYGYHFSQFSTPFLDLKAEQKMALFMDALPLRVWELASDLAGSEARTATSELDFVSGELSQAEAVLAEIDLKALKEQEKGWEADREETLAEIRKKKPKLFSSASYVALQERARSLGEQHTEAISKLSEMRGERRALENQQASLGVAAKTGRCPTCNAKLPDADHLKAEYSRLHKAIEAKAGLIMSKDTLARTMATELVDVRSKLAELDSVKRANEDIARSIEEWQTRQNPYSRQRKDAEMRQAKLRLKVASLKKAITEKRKHVDHTSHWIKGFKEVRLLQVESVLAQLEAQTNQVMEELGLSGWQINFEIEKETKSGTIRRGFNTMVLSPTHQEPVPWEVWSGGESQRLRLAGTMGFANLIQSISSSPGTNVEFWDEPCRHLDEDGVKLTIEALAGRARKHNRTILLAEHSALRFGRFAGRINVVKADGQSRILL